MRSLACLLFALSFCTSSTIVDATVNFECAKKTLSPDSGNKLKTYSISLDDSPFERWRTVALDHKVQIEDLINYFKKFLTESFGATEHFFSVIEYYFSRLMLTMPQPYREEMLGIAAALNIKESYILFTNIIYEMFTLCTSIVYCDDDKTMIHARNLDFGLLLGWDAAHKTWFVTEKLLPLLVSVDVYKNKTLLHKSALFAGSIVVLTGMKPNGFSVSINERFGLNSGLLGLLEWAMNIDRNQKFVSFAVREALESLPDYKSAVDYFSSVTLVAPVYFMLAGPNPYEACVITRTRYSTLDIWEMNSTNVFLVQTNFDHWKKIPFYDDRVTPSYECYQELKKLNYSSTDMLYSILSTKPVLNAETIHTSFMYIKNGTMLTIARNPDDTI